MLFETAKLLSSEVMLCYIPRTDHLTSFVFFSLINRVHCQALEFYQSYRSEIKHLLLQLILSEIECIFIFLRVISISSCKLSISLAIFSQFLFQFLFYFCFVFVSGCVFLSEHVLKFLLSQ